MTPILLRAALRAAQTKRSAAHLPGGPDRRLQLLHMQRHWRPPAGLTRSRPREIRLAGAGRAIVVLAVSLALGGIGVGLALGASVARGEARLRLLQRDGVDAEARVVRVWRTGGESPRTGVAYRFTAGGRTYESQAKLPRRTGRTLAVGSPLPIRYAVSDPELSHPRGSPLQAPPEALPYVLGLALLSAGLLALLPLRRQRHLLAEGRPALALVTSHAKDQHGIVVHYEFTGMSGAVARGRSGPAKDPPPLGSTVPVIYDAENPARNARYPLSLVRLADL